MDSLERAGDLLTGDARAYVQRQITEEPGYLNLLGTDPDSTGFGQSLMLTRLVPAIYERYWRPALGRVFKGPRGPGMGEELRIARELLAPAPGARVLDLACGPGNFSRDLAVAVGPGGLVVGVDVSRPMLARGVAEAAEAGVENLVLVRADAGRLPFRSSAFDAACCFAALHLFADPFAALDELRRVLAPGGRIALMTSIRPRLTPRAAKPLIERASGMRVFERSEVTAALDHRGFEAIEQRVSGSVQFVAARLA